MRPLFLLSALALLPLAELQAQSARPVRLDPALFSHLDGGAKACRLARMHGAAAQTARRIATFSRDHERLMGRYDVGFVKIDIGLERTSNTIGTGTNVQTWARNVSATVPLDTIGFELNDGLLLDSLLVNGQRVPTSRIDRQVGGDVRVRPLTPVPAGTTFSYHVYYNGTPAASGGSFFGFGLTNETESNFGNQVTWTLSSPFATSDWCPSKQVLADKLDSVEIHITTAADNKAGSNGKLLRTVALPNGKVRYEWKCRYPIDYYLASITVSNFQEYVNYAHPANMPNGDSIPIVHYMYPQAVSILQNDMDLAAPLLENFSQKFGLYPFWREKYGHCLAPIGGGMEHQTMSTMGWLNFTLTAHEMCHQWFGDNVTCRSYRDLWLNEGFATYGEFVSIEALAPPGTTLQWLNGYRQGAFQFTGSVVVPAADTFDIARMFDGNLTYAKGGLVLHMLRHHVNNDSAFFAAMRNYQQQYGGRTATTADLQRSLETSLNLPLQWFFDQWLYGEGFPRSTVRWNQVGSNLIIENDAVATAPASVPVFRMKLEFDYTINGLPQTFTTEQTQSTQRWIVPLAAGATVTNVQFDPRKWTLTQLLRIRRDNSLGVTGLADDGVVTRVTVYPNPCTDFLTVPTATKGRTAEVLDLSGRVVRRTALAATAAHLPTNTLAAGSYLLRLTDAAGAVQVARFCKQ